MKRYVICLAALFFLFMSCENFSTHNVNIKNDSHYTVRFQLERYGDELYTLTSGTAITLDIYNNPILIFQGHPRVMYTSSDSVTISDLPSYDCTIYNETQNDILINETNYRLGEELDDEGIVIPAATYSLESDGSSVIKNISSVATKLYTTNPNILAVDTQNVPYTCTIKSYIIDEKTVYEIRIQ